MSGTGMSLFKNHHWVTTGSLEDELPLPSEALRRLPGERTLRRFPGGRAHASTNAGPSTYAGYLPGTSLPDGGDGNQVRLRGLLQGL